MRCPRNDGELVAHTTRGEQNLDITYSRCPTCRGYWMSSFAANFIVPTQDDVPQSAQESTLTCPVCSQALERATGENIPEGSLVYQCPVHHGYFFPAGELSKFKKAQKAKLSYHKLWNIPLPSVASVLLASIVFLILSGGLVATFIGVRQRQQLESQAQEFLRSQEAIVSKDGIFVTIIAATSTRATVTVYLDTPDNPTIVMDSSDGTTHRANFKNLPRGTHAYWFTIRTETQRITTPQYSLRIP